MKEVNEKIDTILDLIMKLSKNGRQKNNYIEEGAEASVDIWEIVVKYKGNIREIARKLKAKVEILSEKCAIFSIEEEKIDLLLKYKEIKYIEKPKRLISSYECNVDSWNKYTLEKYSQDGLKGNRVIIGMIDTGIDYTHLDFIKEDGKTRILSIWDQSVHEGTPPKWFNKGSEWTRRDINKALKSLRKNKSSFIIPHVDVTGRGTCRARVAAGNGRASKDKCIGIAPEADIIVVKLNSRGRDFFSNTTEFMRAVRYLIDKAKKLNRPLIINTGFIIDENLRDGNSLFKSFIDDVIKEWTVTLVVPELDEDNIKYYTRDKIGERKIKEIEFKVGKSEKVITLEIWKDFFDVINFNITNPSGYTTGKINGNKDLTKIEIGTTECYLYFKDPFPYDKDQEVFLLLIPEGENIEEGIWRLTLYGEQIVDGNYDIRFIPGEMEYEEAGFLESKAEESLRIRSSTEQMPMIDNYAYVMNTFKKLSSLQNPLFLPCISNIQMFYRMYR
ncbi:MAG: hypothetical protein PWQ37_1332 [Candidatus Petromonas sp.]|jgi:hypothetical protein|nr:hypothetical protein [Candidatus Petromonas sp.]